MNIFRRFLARVSAPQRTGPSIAVGLAVAGAIGLMAARGDNASLRIVAFGDSLSAGQGLSASAGFPGALEARLRADGYRVRVINAGVPGDSSAQGLARMPFVRDIAADLVLVEFGANDLLRRVDPSLIRDNLDKIIGGFKARNIRVLLVGQLAASEFSLDYRKAFDAIYPELAAAHSIALHPSFLEKMCDDEGRLIPALLQDDGAHPNAAGVQRIAAHIAPIVERELNAFTASRRFAKQR